MIKRLIIVFMVFYFPICWAAAFENIEEPSNGSSITKECHGCHTNNRLKVVGYFSNGFGRWTDFNCYGCHKEITEVARKYITGIKDSRFLTLPLSDERVNNIDTLPLPYLNAKSMPFIDGLGGVKVSKESLTAYLKRPHGFCVNDDNVKLTCNAPPMMAYPNITEKEISGLIKNIKNEYFEKGFANIAQGRKLYLEACHGCHKSGGIALYDSVGLSLFSSDWILRYANGRGYESNMLENRTMPIFNLTKSDVNDLTAFFRQQRRDRESKLDFEIVEIAKKFDEIPLSSLKPEAVSYLWGGFWRDADCVHCHSIDGRAKAAFETSITGIKAYFSEKSGYELYERLVIREYEKKWSIGAEKPGMPMTGEPLPRQFINLIGKWVKLGCIDENKKRYCS